MTVRPRENRTAAQTSQRNLDFHTRLPVASLSLRLGLTDRLILEREVRLMRWGTNETPSRALR